MSSDLPTPIAPGALSLRGVAKGYRLYQKKWGRAAEWLGLGADIAKLLNEDGEERM